VLLHPYASLLGDTYYDLTRRVPTGLCLFSISSFASALQANRISEDDVDLLPRNTSQPRHSSFSLISGRYVINLALRARNLFRARYIIYGPFS